jgi:putative copper export protein
MIVLDGALRTTSDVGLVLFVGVNVFLLYLWPEGRWSATFTGMAWAGWALLAASTVGLLFADAARTHRGVRDVIATLVGTSLMTRLILLCVAGAWLREVETTYGATPYRAIAPAKLVAGIAILVLTPLTFVTASRSMRGSWASTKVVMEAAHITAVMVWLGSLVVLAVILVSLDDLDAAALRRVLPRFSVVAVLSSATIAISGALIALAQSGRLSHLVNSGYGALILAKLLALVAVLIAGSRGRRYARARHAGERGPRALRWAVVAELLIATTALALSAALAVIAV